MGNAYAGIGSRQTPEDVLTVMYQLGHDLAEAGWILRSGHAHGADRAFEEGATAAGGVKRIYTAKNEIPDAWFELAEKHHPAWGACDKFARRLHARNGAIILGDELQDPVEFVVCWTQAGLVGGGTGQALRICEAREIPVFNLFHIQALTSLKEWLRARSPEA